MSELDPSAYTAAQLSSDQTLSPATLGQIAQVRPDLWQPILAHPNCYPALREFINQYMPTIGAQYVSRQQASVQQDQPPAQPGPATQPAQTQLVQPVAHKPVLPQPPASRQNYSPQPGFNVASSGAATMSSGATQMFGGIAGLFGAKSSAPATSRVLLLIVPIAAVVGLISLALPRVSLLSGSYNFFHKFITESAPSEMLLAMLILALVFGILAVVIANKVVRIISSIVCIVCALAVIVYPASILIEVASPLGAGGGLSLFGSSSGPSAGLGTVLLTLSALAICVCSSTVLAKNLK